MSGPPFGIDPVALLVGLNVAVFAGWTFTLYMYRRVLRQMKLANFWWSWWVETAVRHGIELGEDDLEAASELAPDESPIIQDQVSAVTTDPDEHFAAEAAQ